MFRHCTKCFFIKPLSEFYKSKGRKYGHQSSCKECRKKWCEENKEKIALCYKKHYEKNKEKIALYNKKYCEENKEQLALSSKKYREENKEQIALSRKKHCEENKEQLTLRDRRRCEKLSDNYIKSTIIQGTNLKHSDVPQELIDLKRATILLKRLVKQQTSEGRTS